MRNFRQVCMALALSGACVASCLAQGQVVSAKGVWLGTLVTGGPKLRIQFHLQMESVTSCTLDSLDQGAMGIPCTNLAVTGASVSLEIPAVHGSYKGTLSADGKTLTGTFTQGADLPLVLEKQAGVAAPAAAPTADAAMPPVGLGELKAVLEKDLAGALNSGALAAGTHGGVTVGVVMKGQRLVMTFGEAKPDGVYEIGSISKTFTATILAQMVEQKKVRLDEPVRELLPAGTVAKPASGLEITLLDLSDQHSGLPRMPDNFHPADRANPYADYDAKALYAFMGKVGVGRKADAPFVYSNLGVGLLGQALANRAGVAYPALLQAEVLGPLGMKDTAVVLTPSMKARFVQGHDAAHKPAHAWDLDALAGAGGIRSTADDMLTYLEAQLHPEKLPEAKGDAATLAAAIRATHGVRADADGGMKIALNWFQYANGSYWHNGGTGGFSSYARFCPEKDYAVIVLFNTAPGDGFADRLGGHVAQRIEGRAAVAL